MKKERKREEGIRGAPTFSKRRGRSRRGEKSIPRDLKELFEGNFFVGCNAKRMTGQDPRRIEIESREVRQGWRGGR